MERSRGNLKRGGRGREGHLPFLKMARQQYNILWRREREREWRMIEQQRWKKKQRTEVSGKRLDERGRVNY